MHRLTVTDENERKAVHAMPLYLLVVLFIVWGGGGGGWRSCIVLHRRFCARCISRFVVNYVLGSANGRQSSAFLVFSWMCRLLIGDRREIIS